MRQNRSKIIFAVVAIIFLALAVRFGFTVVTTESAQQAVEGETFDPVTFVDNIWTSTLLPAYESKSVNLAELISKFTPDTNGIIQKESLAPITEKFGIVTVGEAHVYMIKATGKVVAVDSESSIGTMEIQVDGYEGPIKVLMYLGPRIPSDETSVRDAGGFIKFGDFKEQTEYGKVASAINKKVLSEVITDSDKTSWVGKTITIEGAFSIRTFNLIQIDLKEIRIVPTSIELGD